MMKYFCSLWMLILPFNLINGQSLISPLPNAHAHNDYEQEYPLYDALKHGFTSVEADVHLIDGQLYVSHDKPSDLSHTPTLAELYLDPLDRWVKQHEGEVYRGYEQVFYLMIDIKTEAESTYDQLKKELENYKHMLHYYKEGEVVKGPVRVFLSGNRPIEQVRKEKICLVGIDGRPSDIGKGYSADFMPIISDNYRKHLSWRAKEGQVKPEQVETLKAWVAEAHEEGKKVRLWASPEEEKVWRLLLDIGIDLLNTDKLTELKQFLLAQ